MSRVNVKSKDPNKEIAVGIEIPRLGGNWFLQVFERDADGGFDDPPTVEFETRSNSELLEKMKEVGVDESDPRTKGVMGLIAMDLDPGRE